MSDSFAPSGIDLPSSTLPARLAELAAYLAAPAAGRLTEEQRALALGIARRVVCEIARELDPGIDADILWQRWLADGVPAAARLAAPCFARAEEHRWREQSMQQSAVPSVGGAGDARPDSGQETLSSVDHAYLQLQIADGRRRDALGNPCIAPADLDPTLFRTLLLDIAAWQLGRIEGDQGEGARLGNAVNGLMEKQASAPGIDAAARDYHAALVAEQALADAAETAIARHDWPALIALAASAHGARFEAMAVALLSAEPAALPLLLAPLRLDRAALAPLEASLAQLTDRAVPGDVAGNPVPLAEVRG